MNTPATKEAVTGRLLLVTVSDPDAPPGGRELLYRLNQSVLGDLFGERLSVFRPAGAQARSPVSALRGHIDGLTPGSLDQLCAAIERDAITSVFIDGSNLGIAAKRIKQRFPSVRVFTFFHNVEARFLSGIAQDSPIAAGVGGARRQLCRRAGGGCAGATCGSASISATVKG